MTHPQAQFSRALDQAPDGKRVVDLAGVFPEPSTAFRVRWHRLVASSSSSRTSPYPSTAGSGWRRRRSTRAGYDVSVISPKGKGFEREHETIEGVDVHRHDLRVEGHSAVTYLREYAAALRAEWALARRIYRETAVRRHPLLQPA